MVNPWQLLGVEPGSDRKTIKRAYTRLIKDVHPEERPDDFMQLREAYEWALKTLESPSTPMVFSPEDKTARTEPLDFSGWGNAFDHETADNREASTTIRDSRPENDPGPAPKAETINDDLATEGDTRSAWDQPPPIQVADDFEDRQQQLNQLILAISHLLENLDLRNNLAHWEPLLTGPELDDFQLASAVSHWLLAEVVRILQSGSDQCPLEPALIARLNHRFHWLTDHRNIPISDDKAFRLSLLIEAADQQLAGTRARFGWRWLAHTLLSLSGRISRIECLLGLATLLGAVLMTAALSGGMPGSDGNIVTLMTTALLMLYCLICLMIKRTRDVGINPALAITVGIIFPAVWIFYLLGAPKHNEKVKDPRLKFSPAYERAYREYFAAHRKRELVASLTERFSRIHSGVYLTIAVLWIGGFLLLKA
ncbi:J domain-containing protein [Marinobacter confluentis]|uniref:J domain-containing protein n=1 Tax=Marinobacter confluentis TaxID=1697557 RepID=A0A4Z1C7S1_9GAMM|nr:J domain-containing protein [Marinobacter confluentis]TGN38848.1 hypothetical protein E5Q11_14040 [Marinobacter confluentis]